MTDIIRTVELCSLIAKSYRKDGDVRTADLGPGSIRVGCYIDTGAGKTVCSSELARQARMIEIRTTTIDYLVPVRVRAKAYYTAIRLCERGCDRPVPLIVAVSDTVINALDLGGLQILIGQDLLQAAHVRLDLAPRGAHRVSCRMVEREEEDEDGDEDEDDDEDEREEREEREDDGW
jgi:hypothetical protein